MTRFRVRYGEIAANVTEDMGQQVWSNEELESLKILVKILKMMLLEMFDKHCNTRLHTLKYHLFDHMLNDTERYGALFIFNSRPYELLNVHIKQAFIKTLQGRRT